MDNKDITAHSAESQEGGLLDPENLEPLIQETKKLEEPIQQLLAHGHPPAMDIEQIENRIDILQGAVDEITQTSQNGTFRNKVINEIDSITTVMKSYKNANKYWLNLKSNVSDPIERINELLPRHTAKKLAEDFAAASNKVKIRWLYCIFFTLTAMILSGAIAIGIWSSGDEISWNFTVLRYSIITPLIPGIFLTRKLILLRNTEIATYRHKQAVLETYIGFNEKLEGGDKNELAKAVVNTIVEKPI